MDPNLTLIVIFAIASPLVMGVASVFISFAFLRRSDRQQREAVSVTGEHAQVQVNHAGSGARIDARGMTKTDIQVYEDALAKLAATNDTIDLAREIVEAARSGLFHGDLAEHLGALLGEARDHTELSAFILQRGRVGEYVYRTTEGELVGTRENGSGH
jgi:hypothetical protein